MLYVISVLAPAGAEQSVLALAPALAERGVDVELAYLRDRPGTAALLADTPAKVVSLVGEGGAPARARRALILAKSRRPDLIHTTLTEANVTGRLVGALTGTPVVSSLVNVTYGPEQLAAPDRTRRGIRARHLLDVLTARRVVRFHSVTKLVADVMAPRLRVPRDRIDVVPRGRDPVQLGVPSAERRRRVRAALGIGPDEPVILVAARQDYQKGLDVLLEAMPAVLAERPDARLLLAGRDGTQTPVLKEAAARHRLAGRVSFLGLRSDVPDLMCAADVFAMPSRWEGMGGVLLEAMALGAPVVTSDLATLREALPDESHAWFVPPEQPQPLGRALLQALAEPAEAARRAERARDRFFERFTIDRVADGMRDFYHRALAEAGRAS